jgi:hypothetical protein
MDLYDLVVSHTVIYRAGRGPVAAVYRCHVVGNVFQAL